MVENLNEGRESGREAVMTSNRRNVNRERDQKVMMTINLRGNDPKVEMMCCRRESDPRAEMILSQEKDREVAMMIRVPSTSISGLQELERDLAAGMILRQTKMKMMRMKKH